LSGNFDLSSTNLNLAVINIKNPELKLVINLVAGIPELLRNPIEGGLSMLAGALGLGKGGLTDELSRSPVDAVAVKGQVGAGQVKFTQGEVRSSAFMAEATGTITLAPVLTNSALQMPISLSLSRKIANQLSIPAGNTPTNAPYVKLPDFASEKGTIGDPKLDIDKLKLASFGLQMVKGAGAGLQGIAGSAVGAAESLLGGKSSTNGSNTNSIGSAVGGLLQGFLGGNQATNAPGKTNQEAQPSIFDLIPRKK
jgi:hypothetical protein